MKNKFFLSMVLLMSSHAVFSTVSEKMQNEFSKFNKKFEEILQIVENIALEAEKDLPVAANYGATAVKNVIDGIGHIEHSIIPDIKADAASIASTHIQTPSFTNIADVFHDLQQPVYNAVSMLKHVLEVLKYVTAMSYNLGASVQVLGNLVQTIPGAQDVSKVFQQGGVMLTSKLPHIFNTVLSESQKIESGIHNGLQGVEAMIRLFTTAPSIPASIPMPAPPPAPPAINLTPLAVPTLPPPPLATAAAAA